MSEEERVKKSETVLSTATSGTGTDSGGRASASRRSAIERLQAWWNDEVGKESIKQWQQHRRLQHAMKRQQQEQQQHSTRATGATSRAEGSSPPVQNQESRDEPTLDEVDLYDPDAPPAILHRHTLFQYYTFQPVEDEFVAFLGGNRSTVPAMACVVSILVPLATWGANAGSFGQYWERWGLITAATVIICVLVSFFHFFVVIRGTVEPRFLEWCWWRKAVNVAAMEPRIKRGLAGEVFALAIWIAASFAVVLDGLGCTEGVDNEFTRWRCESGIAGYIEIINVFPAIVLRIRCIFSVPFALYNPTAWYLFRWLTGGPEFWPEPLGGPHALALKYFVHLAFTTFFCAGFAKIESYDRQRFEAAVVLRRRQRKLQEQQAFMDNSLRSLLPASVVQRLLANQPVLDVSPHASVSVSQIGDLLQWSCSIPPGVVVETVDAIFMTFDVGVPRFGLNKVRTIGDRYIVSHGLEGGGIRDTSAIVHAAFWQQAVSAQLGGMLTRPFSLQIGISTGPCFGGIIGTQSLWYEVYGDAMDDAMLLAKHCPAGAVLVAESTRCGYGDSFIDDEYSVMDQPPSLEFDSVTGAPVAPTIRTAYILQGVSLPFGSVQLEQQQGETTTVNHSVTADETTATEEVAALDEARKRFLRTRLHHDLRLSEEDSELLTSDVDGGGGGGSASADLLEEAFVATRKAESEEVELLQKENFACPQDSPWPFSWTMRFRSAEHEEAYKRNCHFAMKSFMPVVRMTVAGTVSVMLLVMLSDGTGNMLSALHGLLAVLCVVGDTSPITPGRVSDGVNAVMTPIEGLLRFLGRCFPSSVKPYLAPLASLPWLNDMSTSVKHYLFRMCVMSILLLGTMYYIDGASVLNRRPLYLYVIVQYVAMFGGLCKSWTTTYTFQLLWNVFCVFGTYVGLHRRQVTPALALLPVVFGWPIDLFVYYAERQRRTHFRDIALSTALANSSKNAYALQRALLSMLLPVTALPHVLEKIQRRSSAMICTLGTMSIAACHIHGFLPSASDPAVEVECDPQSPTSPRKQPVSLLRVVEKHFEAIESIIARGGSQVGVAKIYALGDTILIGGPLLDSMWDKRLERVNMALGASGAMVGGHTLRAALGLLDVLLMLKYVYEGRLTAVISCGSAVSAVLGHERPVYEILSPAAQQVVLCQQATAKGIIGMTPEFAKLLRDHRVSLPRTQRRGNDFEVGGHLTIYPQARQQTFEDEDVDYSGVGADIAPNEDDGSTVLVQLIAKESRETEGL